MSGVPSSWSVMSPVFLILSEDIRNTKRHVKAARVEQRVTDASYQQKKGREMRNWDEMSAPWLKHEAFMEAAHAPVLDAMLAKAALVPGEDILDIGMGAGLSTVRAAEAVGASGRVLGVDVAPPFVARARDRVPAGTRVLAGDAQGFAFEPASFDAAISIFGTMFFADTTEAFANIRGAMRSGARFVFACWALPADNPWLSTGTRVTNEVLGPPVEPPNPADPGPFRFSDAQVARDALTRAGWSARHETVALQLTPIGGPEEIAEIFFEIGPSARRVTEEGATNAQAAAIRAGITKAYQTMQDASGAVRVPASVHLIEAIAP